MSMVMYRSFAEAMGFNWPREIAFVTDDYKGGYRQVTWKEVHKARTERMHRNLEWKRQIAEPTILPCYVWTFFNVQDIPYHGWYCYVVTRYFDIGVNFRGFDKDLAMSLMRTIPFGLLPLETNFYKWMELFAKNYPRKPHPKDKRKSGSLVGWLIDRKSFTFQRP